MQQQDRDDGVNGAVQGITIKKIEEMTILPLSVMAGQLSKS
jgi:hypothetical protein